MIRMISKNSIYTLLFAAVLFVGSTSITHAQSALEVQFENEPSPLFSNADVKPGDSISRNVTVVNNGNETEKVYVDVSNTFGDGLEDVMELTIVCDETQYYDNYFANFFTEAPVGLGSLASGATKDCTFTASLDSSIGNEYQKTTMGFDICVGFEGGEVECDGSTNGGGGDDDDDGGGGGGGGSSACRIANEEIEEVTLDGATLSWTTNRDATTYLVCGNETDDGPFTLDPDETYFGYTFDVDEVDNDTQMHEVTLEGLDQGDTYSCRPASRCGSDDDFTVGDELTFDLPDPEVEGESTSVPPFGQGGGSGFAPQGSGSVLGVATGTDDESNPGVAGTSTIVDSDQPGVVAGIATSTIVDFLTDDANCLFIWLFLLVVISFSWSVIGDVIRPASNVFRHLFIRQAIFSGVYVLLLLLAYWIELLSPFVWLFAGAWVIMTVLDYRSHIVAASMWDAKPRNLFYALLAFVFVVTSFWFDIPCVWWPFFVITVASGLLFFFDDRDQ